MSQKPPCRDLFLSLLWHRVSLVALFAIFTALFWFFTFPLAPKLGIHPILFKILLVIVTSIAYKFILQQRITPLIWGWALFLYSLWLDLIKEFTQEPEWWGSSVVSIFKILGLSLIAVGFYYSRRTFEATPLPKTQATRANPRQNGPTASLNRTRLQNRVGQAMVETLHNRQQLALFFLDLDYFKEINDSLGHDIGDAELVRVKHVLHRCVEATDTTLRIGGDEFAIIQTHIMNLDEAALLAQSILDTLSEPHLIQGHEIHISASIGIALFPTDADTAKQLLKNADIAMYHAKHKGRNNYQFYTPGMNARAHSRTALARDLRQAFEAGNLYLQFQPQLDVSSGKTVSFEALLRWRHPEHGLLTRQAFIRLAEETGLIIPIGSWILEKACQTCLAWQALDSNPLHMAVNLSPRQFRQPGLADNIAAILERTGLSPTDLEVEITEGLLLENMDAAAATLQSLSMLGVHISVDDFGTGYSSLTYLKRLPFDSLKIDRSFVHNIPHDTENQAITKAIIALGHNLDLKVVAEGVETLEQFLYLRKLGCDMAQGYFISKPLDHLKAQQWWKEKGRQGFPSATLVTGTY